MFVFLFVLIAIAVCVVFKKVIRKIEPEKQRSRGKEEFSVSNRRKTKGKIVFQQRLTDKEKSLLDSDKFGDAIAKMQLLNNKIEPYVKKNVFDPIPASFKDKRKECRDRYIQGKKDNDTGAMQGSLMDLYLLGLIYVYCYGSRDGNKGVIGWEYNNAIIALYNSPDIIKYFKEFSYKDNGQIWGCKFISSQDWGRFESVWGLRGEMFDLRDVLDDFPGKTKYIS